MAKQPAKKQPAKTVKRQPPKSRPPKAVKQPTTKPVASAKPTPVAAILATGAYIPRTRIERRMIAEMWSGPAVPGERSLAASDEDSITMAVEAGLNCLTGWDLRQIDGLYFASTSAPYAQRQAATIVASAMDLREDVVTMDFADSLRAGTAALRAARDAVASGSARLVLVVCADRRAAEPESPFEQIFGDGAAAVLVGPEDASAIAAIETIVSVNEDVTMGWRRTEDRFVRSYNPKHEMDFGFTAPLVRALLSATAEAGIDPGEARLAIPSPDGRAQFKVAREAGVPLDRIADSLVLAIGVLGTPAAFISLISALEVAKDGEVVLLGAAGEGADVVVLRVRSGLAPDAWRPARLFEDRRLVSSYGDLVRANKLMDLPTPLILSSPITAWRDRAQDLNLHGMRCTSCKLVQFPIGRVCQRCKAKDQREEIPLARRGTLFTYTFDHVVAATYSTIPVTRAIVDLEGGGRFLTSVTDVDPDDVFIGMPVELSLRRVNDGGGFKNYYWKARPAAGAATAKKEGAA